MKKQSKPTKKSVAVVEWSNGGGKALRTVAYEALRQQIQALDLEPGFVTSDSELARRLGMSRTPVREALTLLERDFLVTRIPNHGVRIREITTDEIVHILNMREALDGMAAHLAATRIDDKVLDHFQRAFEEAAAQDGGIQPKQHARLSQELHSTIIVATGNPFLQSTSQTLRGIFERSRQHGWRTWNRTADARSISDNRYAEHLAIIAALRRRDPEAAEAAARVHVTNGLRDILKALLS
ncbi:MAG: GntR family transcriptional regulator [Proteobacteria bacterium]|nr:GntR family transcriptional regulator [Pseudomonadota bacterium]